MFNLGMGEITVIALLALIFIGPKKLPELASGLGRLIREIRKTTSDVKNEIQLDDTIRKPFEELRDAVTLHPEELKRRDRLRREMEETKREANRLLKEAEAAEAAKKAAEGVVGQAPGGATDAAGDAAPAAIAGAGSGPQGAGSGPVAFPSPPTAPPTGTIARGPSAPLPSSLRRPPGPAEASMSRTTSSRDSLKGATQAPPVDSAADRSNTTQSLSEEDLAAIGVSGSAPPPPPLAARLARTFPPPSPALPGTTAPPSLGRTTGGVPTGSSSASAKSGPIPAPLGGTSSGPVGAPSLFTGRPRTTGQMGSAPPPAPAGASPTDDDKKSESTT